LRMVRGVTALVEYLKSIGCSMSEATIYRLVRTKKIPFNRPSSRVLLFNLDQIDAWVSGQTE
jgi:predicted DNA-binding transcriptional regulator AlpA